MAIGLLKSTISGDSQTVTWPKPPLVATPLVANTLAEIFTGVVLRGGGQLSGSMMPRCGSLPTSTHQKKLSQLRIVETVMESNTQLIANVDSWKDEWKRRKLTDIKMLLDGAIAALGKVGLMLNVEKKNLAAVLSVLPALKKPTISHLSDEEWLALNTILDETTVRTIIPRLKEAGAQGIVEYPLNKIVM